MNLFPNPSERDPEFKNYLSQLKAAAKAIDTASTTRGFNDQMRQIVEKFPYFGHTTPRVMAVAIHMVMNSENPNEFDRERAATLIDTVFANFRTTKDRSTLIIDVARYYKHLLDPT